MKTSFLTCLLFVASCTAFAQVDTLQYDNISSVHDRPLMAVMDYLVESQVVHTTTFTPTERCTVTHLLVGGSVIKFDSQSGRDTLVVALYDDLSLPLKNVYQTWRFDMGTMGFPSPNITAGDPLSMTWRDVMVLKLDPPPVVAPARDFTLGVYLKTKQNYVQEEDDAYFHGLTFSFIENSPEYARYRRYQAFVDGAPAYNPVGQTARYALYMRAVVNYDGSLPNTNYTSTEELATPAGVYLAQNYPNPFTGSTSVEYSLEHAGYTSLAVYDMLGRRAVTLTDGWMNPGVHQATVSAQEWNLAPGMYILRLRQGAFTQTRNIVLMK